MFEQHGDILPWLCASSIIHVLYSDDVPCYSNENILEIYLESPRDLFPVKLYQAWPF